MLLTTICLVLLFSSSLAFVPESGSNRERLDGCSSSSINAASLHFTKVGQIKSHSGYIHLASKSNVSVLPHMVIRACSMLVDLKQLELFKKVENDHNRNNLSVKRKSLQSGHYDRVLQLMSNRCISTLDRTVDVLELYFNSFSHGGDETHIAEHKTNVLRAQMKFARTYRDVIGLSQKDRRPSLKDRNKPYSRRFRNKKDLNSTMQQDWLGLRIRASEFNFDPKWNDTSNLTWANEPWPPKDPRWDSEWWFLKYMRGEWVTFPLLPSIKYLPKKSDGSVNFSLWTTLRDEVSQKVIDFERKNRKERRRIARQAEKSDQNGGFRFRFLFRKKRQIVMAVFAIVALASFLFNQGSVDGIASRANSNVDATVRLMDSENHRLAIQEHSIQMLNKSMEIVRDELTLTKLQLSADELVEEVGVALEVFYTDVDRVLDGLETLARGKLSPSLLKVRDTMKHLTEIQQKLEPHGLRLGISKFEDIYRQEASTVVYSNGTMFNIVHLDTYESANTFDVFSFVPTPYSHSKKSAFTVGTEDLLLAINRDESKFFTLTHQEYEECRSISGNTKICPAQNVVSRNLKSSCLSSLFRGDFDSASKLCSYNQAPDRELITQLNGNEFIVHSASERTMIKYICRDGDDEVSKTEFISGSVKLVVQPLCSAITPSNEVTGQLAFAADLPGFELRPLNISELLSTDGVLFDTSYMEQLVEYGQGVGADVPVESVASQFKHFHGTGLLSGVSKWFSNTWKNFATYIRMGIFGLFAILFAYLFGPCCISRISNRCSSVAGHQDTATPRTRRKLSFSIPSRSPFTRLAQGRRSILKGRRVSTVSTKSALALAAAEAEANPATARRFLQDLKSKNEGFNEKHVLELSAIMKAAARCKCDKDSCICDDTSINESSTFND